MLIYVSALTYGHEIWVVTERIRLEILAAKMSSLHRVAVFSVTETVRSMRYSFTSKGTS